MHKTVLSAADLWLNIKTHTVTRDNHEILLRRKEWQLLAFLLCHQGYLATHEMILDHVWENECDVFPNVVAVQIKHLCDKIDKPFPKHLIKTIYGWEYMLQTQPF